MKKLAEVLAALEEVAQSGSLGVEGSMGVEAGVLLTQIAIKAVETFKAGRGEPMDLTELHQINND